MMLCENGEYENGTSVCNPEWNMCFQVFRNDKIMALDIWLVLNEPLEDLVAYGKKPKNKNHEKSILRK